MYSGGGAPSLLIIITGPDLGGGVTSLPPIAVAYIMLLLCMWLEVISMSFCVPF